MTLVLLLPLLTLLLATGWLASLWPYRNTATVRFLLGAGIGATGWALFYTTEILAPDSDFKLFLAACQYPFIGLLPVAWIGLALTLARGGTPPAARTLAAAAALPLLVQPLVWTNRLHHWIWTDWEIRVVGELQLLVLGHGPLFWLFNLYSLLLIVAGLLLMLWTSGFAGSLRMPQRAALICSAILPVAGNLAYTLQLTPLTGLDLTPFAFVFSVIGLSYAIGARQRGRIILTARDTILENLPEAVFVVDGERVLVYANRAAATLACLSRPLRADARIEPLLDFLPADWPHRLATPAGEVLETTDAAGGTRYFRAQSLRIDGGRAGAAGHLLLLTDMTAERLTALRIEQASRAAQAASEAKSQFLANMSHEIRTPMNAIVGLADVLARRPLPADAQQPLAMIHDSALALLGVLNDILDFAAMQEGKLALSRRPIALRPLLEEACALHRGPAAAKGLELELQIAAQVPEYVECDPLRLRQILLNLLSNAVKFTREGGVTLAVERHPHTAGRLLFHVRDSGPGILPEHLERIFLDFEQADNSNTRSSGGAGLGLAIARRIAGLMGGDVTVASTPGTGSTFTAEIELPACPGDAAPAAPSAVTPAAAAAAPVDSWPGRRALIVDDNAVNSRVMQLALRRFGIECELAVDGSEALERARSTAYDMIFMDLQMPVMDGFEATRAIRELPQHATTPIIAVTADVMSGERERCLAAGMDDYLGKPVMLAQLQAALLRQIPATPPG